MDKERIFWTALAAGAAIGAGIMAREGAAAGWRYARSEEPPLSIDDERASWRSLLAWTMISGLCVSVARVVGQGAASGAWRKTLGRNPPA